MRPVPLVFAPLLAGAEIDHMVSLLFEMRVHDPGGMARAVCRLRKLWMRDVVVREQ